MSALPVQNLVELDIRPSVRRRVPCDGDGRRSDRLNLQAADFGRNGRLRRQRDARPPADARNV